MSSPPRSLGSRSRIAIELAGSAVRVLALALAVSCTGCAIRYDATGVTRVGIGLWGFGDPPGANWNLDWPRQEIPDLPAGPRPELPPRRTPPDFSSRSVHPPPPTGDPAWTEGPIGDNPFRASRRPSDLDCSMAARVRDRCLVPASG